MKTLSNLKAELRRKEVSLVDLAQALDIHYSSLGKKLNGSSKFSIEEAFRICDILNIDDVKYLFATD